MVLIVVGREGYEYRTDIKECADYRTLDISGALFNVLTSCFTPTSFPVVDEG